VNHQRIVPRDLSLIDPTIEDFSGHNLDDIAHAATQSPPLALESPERRPRGSDLSHADLHGADLRHADLTAASLSRTNLFGARLDHANLESADLRSADLRTANLAMANLKGANVYGAMIDQWTELPFARDEALKRGMVYLEVTPES
jgi:uncharacterized protein YjbI with pentapeptide repeats